MCIRDRVRTLRDSVPRTPIPSQAASSFKAWCGAVWWWSVVCACCKNQTDSEPTHRQRRVYVQSQKGETDDRKTFPKTFKNYQHFHYINTPRHENTDILPWYSSCIRVYSSSAQFRGSSSERLLSPPLLRNTCLLGYEWAKGFLFLRRFHAELCSYSRHIESPGSSIPVSYSSMYHQLHITEPYTNQVKIMA